MTTMTVNATNAVVSEAKGILATYSEFSALIGKNNVKSIITLLEGDDRRTCVYVIKKLIGKAMKAKKDNINVQHAFKDNVQKWVESAICDFSEVLDAEMREVERIKEYQKAGKDCYIAYIATVNNGGEIVTVSRGNSLPIRVMDDIKLLTKVTVKETAGIRAERKDKDGNVTREAKGCYVCIVTVNPKGVRKEAFLSISQDGKEVKPVTDCFRGKRVNIINGIKNIHNNVMR